ncbi:hypothetical protein B4134_1938 [Bacillus safensis]|nr:hypothetical protein B4134_1938 [Bacillus safensis]
MYKSIGFTFFLFSKESISYDSVKMFSECVKVFMRKSLPDQSLEGFLIGYFIRIT